MQVELVGERTPSPPLIQVQIHGILLSRLTRSGGGMSAGWCGVAL